MFAQEHLDSQNISVYEGDKMKPIYEELIAFTKQHGDIIRNPVKEDALMESFMKEYGLTEEEANIFMLVFSAIMANESEVAAEQIREEYKLSFSEYIDFLNVIESLREKGMVVFGEIETTGINFKPDIAIDQNIFQKLVLGRDPLDACELDNSFSIVEYGANLLKQREKGYLSTAKLHQEIDMLLSKVDKKLSAFHVIRQYTKEERAILFITAKDFLEGSKGFLQANDIAETIEEKPDRRMKLVTLILNGNLGIMKDKYVQMDDGFFLENPHLKLTKTGAEKLLNIRQFVKQKQIKPEFSRYIEHETLATALHFSDSFQSELSRLKKAMNPNRFNKLIKALENSGYSKGFVLLFYGGAGTGKTASAYDIANKTHRDVLQVDIEKIRDKYVGESEKNLTQVFEEYEEAKKTLKQTPILLFNEADALLGRRIGVASSVDQMNNSMQNILLQKLENFEGIFIATTNLIDNIDNAFSRRFLYKLEFPKPTADIRLKIWKAKLPGLKKSVYAAISHHELSGGQIELIAKQFVIRNFLEEENESHEVLQKMIEHELSYNSEVFKKMGFLA